MDTAPIYVVSGGSGASGGQLVQTALAQFEAVNVPVVIVPQVRSAEQLKEVVQKAVASRGLIVHTLVDASLRMNLINLAREYNITAVDVMGQLLFHLSQLLEQQPIGQPGLYHNLRQAYFDRIEAIEFTVNHDDGCKPEELHLAEIVLVGVSRVGKTPLSIYLSTHGWKVANVPLIRDIAPPPQLFQVDHRRVIGLNIEPDQLMMHRQRRKARLGLAQAIPYTDFDVIKDEIQYARRIFREGSFATINITDKPIEESADEVIAQISRVVKQEKGDGTGTQR